MKKIREITTEKAWQMHDQLQGDAQVRFINQVMQDEEVDYETALAICQGRTDPKEPEYTLGFKLADPMIFMGMFYQVGKKARAQARANFEKDLDEDELKLFREQVCTMSIGAQLKAGFKKAN